MQNSIIYKHAQYHHSGTDSMKSRAIIVYHRTFQYIISANENGSELVKVYRIITLYSLKGLKFDKYNFVYKSQLIFWIH